MLNTNNLLNLACLLILLFKLIGIIINNPYLTQMTYYISELINIIIIHVNSSQIRIRQVNMNMTHLLNVLGGLTRI